MGKQWSLSPQELERRRGPRTYATTDDRKICLFCDKVLRRDNTVGTCRTHRKQSPVHRAYQARLYQENIEQRRLRSRKYTHKNKDKKRAYDAARVPLLRDKRRPYYAAYARNRTRADVLYRLERLLRKRIWDALTAHFSKNKHTAELLGADIPSVKEYIERQFIAGMGWGNYGEWHIDHKIPLASAHSKEEMEKLCHYTNLQPLWRSVNLQKSDRFISFPFANP